MRLVLWAFRTLMRTKAYTFVAVATLAIAIGANTAMFGLLYAVLLRALPYPEPSRLVEVGRSAGGHVDSVTYPTYERWRDGARSFEAIGVHFQNTGVSRVTLTSGEEPESAKGAFVSASFFEVMGVQPQLGRVFTRGEEETREPVAVLSDRVWRTRFGASEAISGMTLKINGLSYRVIGVMPPAFAWPARDNIAWIPITHNSAWARRAGPVPFFRVVGRLKGDVTRVQAQDELRSIGAGETWMAGAAPLRPPIAGNHERTLYLLACAVAFVLLIACANIASLTLARGTKRASELAMRVALGGGRARVAAEMFVESLLVAAVAGAGGVLLGSVSIEAIVKLIPVNIDQLQDAGISTSVVIFSIAASIVSAILFGLVPAWQLAACDPIEALRGLARGTSGGQRSVRVRKILIAGELALTIVLLAGSGLMLRSLAAAQRVELGFNSKDALFFRVLFPESMPAERRTDYFRSLFERLGSAPQVGAAGAVSDLFEVLAPRALGLRAVEGRPPEPPDTWTPLTWTTVGGAYVQAMGAELLLGRWFTAQDGPNSPPVALIDESMARRYWPGENPLGRRFKGQDARGRNDDWVTVIGVVKNMRRQGLDREPTAHVYEWYLQANNTPRDVVVRTAAPLESEVRAIARSLDPNVILSPVRTLESEVDDQLSTRRFQTTLLSTFALIALVLASVGIYGIVSYSVSLRMREFGIRTALGESVGALRTRVLREAMVTAISGIIPGLFGALLLSNLVRSLVFGVSAVDPVSLGGACVVLAAITIVAACAPAIRASRVDPVVALRDE